MDIQDELHIVQSILVLQKEVLEQLERIFHDSHHKDEEKSTKSEKSEIPEHAGDTEKIQKPRAEKEKKSVSFALTLKEEHLIVSNRGIVEDNMKSVETMIAYSGKVEAEVWLSTVVMSSSRK